MYFKNDRMASYMEGDLEVEKGDWNYLLIWPAEVVGDGVARDAVDNWTEAWWEVI